MPDPAIQSRAYSAAHFALELDQKQDVGLFRSIEGGGVKADVMNYQMGGNYERWRQLGKQKYEDIKLQVGMAMSKPFYDWIKDFFVGKANRKTGAIIACDFHYKMRARREFSEAMIKELTFPKLDAQDKNAAYMNIAMAVEDIKFLPGNGQKLEPPKGMEGQKLWTSCNFRFELDGYADACRRVTKVDAFTIKQNVVEYHAGGRQSPTKTPSSIEYPQLSFYLPEADAQPLIDHFNKRAMVENREQIQKNQQTPQAKHTGQIVTYDNAMRPLFTVEFFEAEIVAITPDKADAGSEEIKQVKVDVLTEWMTFSYEAMNVE
ncbi:MAG: phage tail protein [Deltaproteobacteria bacterium]|nr:phage tail protein [Deltaproteobacteria bacterium]